MHDCIVISKKALIKVMCVLLIILPFISFLCFGSAYADSMVVFNQGSYESWKTNSSNLKKEGCGAFTSAHAIQWLLGTSFTKSQAEDLLRALLDESGNPQTATRGAYLTYMEKQYGITKTLDVTRNKSKTISVFDNGGCIIVNPVGHYVLANGYTYHDVNGDGTDDLLIRIVDSSWGSTLGYDYGSSSANREHQGYNLTTFKKIVKKDIDGTYSNGKIYWVTWETFSGKKSSTGNYFREEGSYHTYALSKPKQDKWTTTSSFHYNKKLGSWTETPVAAQQYVYVKNEEAEIMPYDASDTITPSIKHVAGDKVIVVAKAYNRSGNLWYKLNDGRYVYSGDVALDETAKPIETNEKKLEFQNVTCPTNYKIGSSGGYKLSGGTLVSNEELKTITSTIKKSDGTVISGPKTRNISGKSYNIKSLDTMESSDNGVHFSWIKTAGNYVWILTATDASGKTLTLEMPFTANSNATSSRNVSIPYIPVSSVSLDKNTDTLVTGNTMVLTATVSPDNATNKGVSWSSDNTTVATVDGNGKVTAVAPGTATIKVTTTDGGKTATCIVTVPASENMSPAEKIRIAILKNEKYDPELDLNNDGKVNAQDYILAKKAELAPVAVPVTDIAWGNMEYKPGETGNVQYHIYPKDATNQSVYCDPYDNEICTVSVDGKIYAKKNGYSYVCIHSTENPDICAWGVICVHDPIQYSYELTVEPSGIIDIHFTAAPNDIDKLCGFDLYSTNYSTHFLMQKSIIPGYNGSELKEIQNDDWSDGQIFMVDTNPKDNLIRADQEITFRLLPDNIDQLWGTQQTYSFFFLPYYQYGYGQPYEKARVEVSVTVSFPEKDVPKSGIEQFVYRCYSIILSRDPDASGLKTWVNELNSGRKAASEIIDNFVRSQEFLGKKKSNADAVEILYKAMLGRGSDPAGKATWVGKLDAGHPFAVVINGFCGSKEFKEICDSYGITPGSVSTEQGSESDQQIRAFVTRCYKIILERDPDGEGMNTWFNELKSRRRAAAEIIEQFVYSQEFQNKKHNNPEKVEILYKAMLGRGSDPAGKADWVGRLADGQPLTAIINGFCGSAEFRAICDAYGITPGSVQMQQLSSQPVVEEEPVAKQTVTKTENNVTKVEIINPSDTENAQLGTAVQAIYINEEKAKEFIGRCYWCILGREASQSELDSWIGQMLNGTKTADQIARGFLFSGEFKDKNVSNEELVKILYRVYLNREADAEGLVTWTQKLDEGTSLQALLDVFAKTNEFIAVVKNMAQ